MSQAIEHPGEAALPRRMGIGEILSIAFQLYQRYWRTLLAIAAVVVVPLTLLQYLLSDLVRTEGQATRNGVAVETATWSVGIAGLVAALAAVVMFLVLTGAITRAVAAEVAGEDPSVEQSYHFGFHRLGSVMLVSVLVGLATVAGLILFVIPGIYIGVRLAVSVEALVVEDRRGTQAMGRSWELVGGHWWHAFGALVVAGLLTGLVNAVITVPFGNTGWLVQAIASAVATVITLPYGVLVGVLLYLDLRARKQDLTPEALRANLHVGDGRRQREEASARSPGAPSVPPGGPTTPIRPPRLGGPPLSNQSAVPPPRFLNSRMPRDIKTGSDFPLQVRVVLDPDADVSSAALKPLEIPPEGARVKLILYAPAPQFEHRSDPQQEVLVPATADSEPVLFELVAKHQGVHELEVTAWRDGTYLGALRMQVTVDQSVATDRSADLRAPLELRRGQGGGSVWITLEGGIYRYQLIRDNLPSEPLESKQLRKTPQQAIEELVGELNAFARGRSALGPEDMRDRMVNRGAALWDEFMPEEFWDRFQTWRRDLTSLTVVSRDQIVPWEILYPPNDEGFLVEQLPIFRWVTGPAAPLALRHGRVGLVHPDPSPESADTEIEALRALLMQTCSPLSSVRSLAQLKRLLRDADFRVLHFACHNVFSQSGAKLMFGEQPFEPVDLKQYRRVGRPPAFGTTTPLVFMNACRTADRAASYTSLDGWADAFVQAGAGAFIGSLWEVRDTTAGRLAQAFYAALLDQHGPVTLSEAIRWARETVRDEAGDPTWLGYTVYGNPDAVMV
jgi:hypothetical protein